MWTRHLRTSTEIAVSLLFAVAVVPNAALADDPGGGTALPLRDTSTPESINVGSKVDTMLANSRPVISSDLRVAYRQVAALSPVPSSPVTLGKVGTSHGTLAYEYAERKPAWTISVDGETGATFEAVGDPTFAPDGRRVGFAAANNGTQMMIVDGIAGPVFLAIQTEGPVFSQDSKKFAYTARSGSGFVIVIDHVVQSGTYEDLVPGSLVFSADGKHFAFAAIEGEQRFVVVDGAAGKKFSGIGRSGVRFRADGSPIYSATRGDKWWIIVGGSEYGPFDHVAAGCPVLSQGGGRRWACAVQLGSEAFMVVDGKPGKPWYGIMETGPVFSDSGEHVAYAGALKSANGAISWTVVIDDIPGNTTWKGVRAKEFYFVGEKFLFVGSDDQGEVLVLGNQMSSHWSGIEAVATDQGGQRLVFAARSGDGLRIVDGEKAWPVTGDTVAGLAVCRDGRRYGFAARSGGRWTVVVDQTASPLYDAVSGMEFDSDCASVAYLAKRSGGWFPVMDSVEGTSRYDEIFLIPGHAASPFRFTANGAVQFLGSSDGSIYRVTWKPPPGKRK